MQGIHRRRPLYRTLLAAAVLQALTTSAGAATYGWSSGTFVDGTTAPNPLGAADTLNITSGSSKFLTGETLVNNGTVNWQAAGENLYMTSAGIGNAGLFDVQGSLFLSYYAGGTPAFTNSGTLQVDTGSTLSFGGGLAFVNSGILSANGTISYSSGNATFNAGTQFTGTGVNAVTSNAAFNGSFSSTNLSLQAGTFAGTGAVVGNGPVQFYGGTLAGDWTVASGQSLTAVAGASKFLIGGSLNNQGTYTWQDDGATFYLGSAGITNQSLFSVQGSTVLSYYSGGTPTFTNAGTATVQVAAGKTLTFGNGVVFTNNGGTLDAGAGATVNYASNNATFNAGTKFTGAGTHLVTSNASFNGAFSSTNLVLQSGSYTGTGAVVANGPVQLYGGTLTGDWTVASGQTLTAVTGANKFLISGNLNNQGTIAWNDDGATFYLGSASIDNQSLFSVQGSTVLSYYSGGTPAFSNAATATVQVAAGKTLTVGSGVVFNNIGGTLNTGSGATINYASGFATFSGGTQFTGAGGTNLVTADARFVDTIHSQNLVLQSGNYAGGDGINPASQALIDGTVNMTGGILTGKWQVGAGQTLNLNDGSNKFITSATLVNGGTLAWNGVGDSTLYLSSASIDNQNLFSVGGNLLLNYYSGGQPLFTNEAAARVQVAAGQTLTVGSIALVNSGRLDAAAGAVINYAGAAATFNAGTQFSGAGSNVVTSDATFNGAFASSNLTLQAGTATGNSAVVNGSVQYTGGVLAGGWTVASGQSLSIGAGTNKFVTGTALTNNGTVNWSSNETLYLSSSTITNNGTLNAKTDGTWYYYSGSQPGLVNNGTLVKSGGAGTFDISTLTVTNAGTMDVQSGTIKLPDGFTNTGTLKGSGAYATNVLTNAGTVAPGESPGTLAIAGSFAQTAAGTLSAELFSAAQSDLLAITGSATLGGTLALSCYAGCTGLANGDTITLLTSGGATSGTFAAVTIAGFGQGFAYNVVYDPNDVKLQVLSVGAVPEPGSYALMLAGLVAVGFMARRRQG